MKTVHEDDDSRIWDDFTGKSTGLVHILGFPPILEGECGVNVWFLSGTAAKNANKIIVDDFIGVIVRIV